MGEKSNSSCAKTITIIAVISALITIFTFVTGIISLPAIFSQSGKVLPPTNITLEIFANQQWLDTGVLIQPGYILTIQYLSDLWSPWPNSKYDGNGSGGNPNCTCNVLLGVSHASLIGKVGNGDPFFVGNQFTQKMGQSGYLFLGINDNQISDNSGNINIRIKVSR
jgi:hypothetical protein